MTAQQVERYCQLLFHRGLPALAHWQATVLLARLDSRSRIRWMRRAPGASCTRS